MRRAFVVSLAITLTVVGVGLGSGCARTKATPTSSATTEPGTAVVSKHTDGDTLHVVIGGVDESVRLIGIDTPETRGRNGLIECFGKEASAHVAALLPLGTPVRVVRDVEARDRYGRLLGYVYRLSDGLFVNLALARDGYADVLTYPPNVAHAEEFVVAVREARNAQRGLWQACGSADVPVD